MPVDSEYVLLRGGFSVPVAPVLLMLDLEGRGFQLQQQGGDLIVRPYSQLTPEDRAALDRWKPHVLDLSELAGLLWSDVDLAAGRVVVRQQLLTGGPKPVFVPTKGKIARTIDVGPQTVELLKTHKVQQAAIKMRHRRDYHDHGLVFAKQWSDVGRKHDILGDPLQINNLGQREFARIIAAAGVRPITLHGLRHTCASLLLAVGVPSRVVQERLGHKKIEITLDIYAHVLPGQQRDAARRLDALLHNRLAIG